MPAADLDPPGRDAVNPYGALSGYFPADQVNSSRAGGIFVGEDESNFLACL